MVQINFALKEVNCKIVYYGPGMSGKTTNLEKIHEKTPKTNAGELTSIATEGDRTLFFDFMPLDLGTIAGMKTKFQIYTVPGQVYYNSTRKIVLQGADGVIFVGDSQPDKIEENRESLKNLEENLKEHGLQMGDIPVVIQWNKQDLPGVLSCEDLDKELNPWGFVSIPASAYTGDGVFPTLKKMSQLVIAKLNEDHGKKSGLKKAPPKAAPPVKPASVDGEDAAPAASATKAKKLSASEILKAKMKEKQAGGEPVKSSAPVSRTPDEPPAQAGPEQPAAEVQKGDEPAVEPAAASTASTASAASAASTEAAKPAAPRQTPARPEPPKRPEPTTRQEPAVRKPEPTSRPSQPRSQSSQRAQGSGAPARNNMPSVIAILVAAIVIAGAVIFALK